VTQDSAAKAKESAVTQLQRDLEGARKERAELGVSAELPSDAEIEDAKAKTRRLVEVTKTHTDLLRETSAADIVVEQYTATIAALNAKQTEEKKDAEWVRLCRRARGVLHVSGLPSLLMREYAKILNQRMRYYTSLWEAPFALKLDENLAFIAEFDDGRVLTGQRLSGGQKIVGSTSFRLAMADTFSRGIGLLILDEPSNHLDSDNIIHLQRLLLELKELASASGRQVIMVDHEESLVGFFDNVITLEAITPTEELT